MTYSWGTKRRFNAASSHMKKKFGNRLQKVAINAGFTCPNRDGTKSTGGCTFCNNNAFNPSYCDPEKSISQQIKEGIAFLETRYKSAGKYLAYFQAFSNTYSSVNLMKKLYSEALNYPGITGLIIGTRPDCIDEETLNYLAELSQKTYLIIEFGIESIYNDTLKKINRGHTYEETIRAINSCYSKNIKCGGHIIFGLPGETQEMMLKSATEISKLPLQTIKFHQLQIIKNTKLGDEYLKNPEKFNLFSLEEYICFISQYISRLSPDIIIERLAGETQPWHNLGIRWNLRYDQVLQRIEKYLEKQNLWQGKYFNNTNQASL